MSENVREYLSYLMLHKYGRAPNMLLNIIPKGGAQCMECNLLKVDMEENWIIIQKKKGEKIFPFKYIISFEDIAEIHTQTIFTPKNKITRNRRSKKEMENE